MLCGRLSLLTNSTRVPCATVSVFGLAPLDVTVIVRPSAPPGDGPEGGELEPQAETHRQRIVGMMLRIFTHARLSDLIARLQRSSLSMLDAGSNGDSNPRVPSPEPRVPSPESRVPSPVSRAPSPEPRAPSPERDYFPVNFGFRFSRNAAAPSALSATHSRSPARAS